MAAHHHNSVFTCGHCGSEFSGRKRKFCSAQCRHKAADQRKSARGIKGTSGKTRRPPNPIIDGHRVCLDCKHNLPIAAFPECRNSKSGYRGQCKPCFAAFNRRRKSQAPKPDRNYQMERIRSAINQGEYGPPTREQHEAICSRRVRPRKMHPTDAEIDRVAKQNAEQAWRHLIKDRASDVWCTRYYAAMGKPWNNPRLSSGEKWKLRYKGDELFAMRERIRSAERKQHKRARTDELLRTAIANQKRSRSIESRLGYTLKALKDHLEKQFTRGMSWDRFKAGEIHIDHITPKSLFNISDDDEYRACWCLSNLRPMWAKDNIVKGARQVHLC